MALALWHSRRKPPCNVPSVKEGLPSSSPPGFLIKQQYGVAQSWLARLPAATAATACARSPGARAQLVTRVAGHVQAQRAEQIAPQAEGRSSRQAFLAKRSCHARRQSRLPKPSASRFWGAMRVQQGAVNEASRASSLLKLTCSKDTFAGLLQEAIPVKKALRKKML